VAHLAKRAALRNKRDSSESDSDDDDDDDPKPVAKKTPAKPLQVYEEPVVEKKEEPKP